MGGLTGGTSGGTSSSPFEYEYAILPLAYAGDVDKEDLARILDQEENDLSWVREMRRRMVTAESTPMLYNGLSSQGPLPMESNHSTTVPLRRQFSQLNFSNHPSSRPLLTPPTPLEDPTATSRQSNTFSPYAKDKHVFAARDSSDPTLNESRYWEKSPSHAEKLLATTPHLRHLNAASREMSGGHPNSNRNPLLLLLSMDKGGVGSSTSRSGEPSGESITSPHSTDYRTFLFRRMADKQVAQDLAAFVRVLAHEMSPEQFTTVESDIFSRILGLMHSPEMKKRLAGVAALDALIGVSSADEEKKATKFATNLSHGLRANHVNYEFLSAVTKALGLMALGAAHVDYVEVEVTRALEWVQVQRSDRR